LRFLPADSLRTSYASLRPGCPSRLSEELAPMPIRVVSLPDGSYEVLDGFKRLQAWRQSGWSLIPVVLERPSGTEEHKRLLLAANCPPRTLTALDEGLVVCSLRQEEGLSPTAISRLLGRKPQWVARRADIATRLCFLGQQALAQGRIGPTLAHALCAFSGSEQEKLLGAIEGHGLSLREALKRWALVLQERHVFDPRARTAMKSTPSFALNACNMPSLAPT